MHKTLPISTLVVAVLAMLVGSTRAQQPYTFSNNGTTLLRDRFNVSLDNETPTNLGNTQGQLVQIGYFSNSTASPGNLFNGAFLLLATFLSGDSASTTSNVPNGRISLTVQFDTSGNATNFPGGAGEVIYTPPNPFPAVGKPLALRWYDTKTTAGFYNTASSTDWLWVAPTNVPQTSSPFALQAATNLEFEDNANPFVASIPEPSSVALLGLAAAGIVARRRRR